MSATLTVDRTANISLGRNYMQALLEKDPKLELVYFSNDTVAAGAMMYCQAAGIKVPKQIALASFSGLEIAGAMPVPITTMRSPRFEMGKLSVERVLARLNGEQVQKVTNAGFELVEGGST